MPSHNFVGALLIGMVACVPASSLVLGQVANPQDMTHRDFPLPPKPALPRLGDIHVPTLVLVGDADIPDVHAHAGAIEAGIPGARRIVIAGVGHIMYVEKPAEFSRLVIGFLERNSQ
jgi:3-oxoadipate enol-lactonase